MAIDETLQDTPDTAQPARPTLHLQFMDLALDPLPNLTVRVSIWDQEKTYTSDAEGNIDGITVRAGARLRIAVQRFDGSYKTIEDTTMPASDTTWNFVSPQLVFEVETQLHQGEPGVIEDSIPKAAAADEPAPAQEGSPGPQAAPTPSPPEPADIELPAPAPTPTPTPAQPPSSITHSASKTTKPPAPAPAPANIDKRKHAADLTLPRISGGTASPARNAAQATGRTAQGNPMVVVMDKLHDWWGHWSLPSLSLWGGHGASPQAASSSSAGATLKCTASRVIYSPSMLPKVQALIAFAEEQTEYLYDKSEGTVSVLAQMGKGTFKHAKGEKPFEKSLGRCYQYVRIALSRANIVDGFVADKESAVVQASASLAGPPLVAKGFVDVTDELPDARWAATGDVIVYAWSDATWAERKKKYGPTCPNHGHIDIRSEVGYISDFIPTVRPKGQDPYPGHPTWFVSADKVLAPNYTNIRIYRKFYDPAPTCRIRAFLACIREFECQSEHDDAKRYQMLNAALPGAKTKTFSGYDKHPWDDVAMDKWPALPQSTAAGAYQITCTTWREEASHQYFADAGSKTPFTPLLQDRMAVRRLEFRDALHLVRKGELAAAVAASKKEWSSLPGSGENAARRTADRKPMDMAYFNGLYEKFLAAELAKYGMGAK
jgi:muramidase (phage lysozyme)